MCLPFLPSKQKCLVLTNIHGSSSFSPPPPPPPPDDDDDDDDGDNDDENPSTVLELVPQRPQQNRITEGSTWSFFFELRIRLSKPTQIEGLDGWSLTLRLPSQASNAKKGLLFNGAFMKCSASSSPQACPLNDLVLVFSIKVILYFFLPYVLLFYC